MAVNAQDMDCNQQVWPPRRDAPKLPKGVCIPDGMFNYITYIRPCTDINGDGMEDFICDWNKKPLEDGDSLYISVYLQNPDSTFSHFKTFGHFYPVFFSRYSPDYMPKDTLLKALLHEVYDGFNPFSGLEIKKDIIAITISLDAVTDLRITYEYDAMLKNWRYSKCEEVSRIDSEIVLRKNLDQAFGPTIDNFCYDYWKKREW
jgi:hypothetical protein